MHSLKLGSPERPPVVFGHGWGRDHRDFIPAAESLTRFVHSHLLDFPGFGKSPRPDATWGSGEYADHVAGYIREAVGSPVVWVGHSFGARVGIQLAARYPDLVRGMLIVSGAGIRPKRSAAARWRGRVRQWRFKMLRARAKGEAERQALEKRFGSPDYIASAELGIRDIFVKVVNEDLSEHLGRVRAPATFLYAQNDRETPPDMGQRMSSGVAGSRFEIVPEFDHNSILSRGYHIVARRVRELTEVAR